MITNIHQIEYNIVENGYIMVENLLTLLKKIIHKILTSFLHLINETLEVAMRKGTREFEKLINDQNNVEMIGIQARTHGDLSDNFIIDKHNKIWLIVWEHSEYGDIQEEIS